MARTCSRRARLLVGAAFLGAVSDAMLLGHWYLVQPGLRRDALNELVRWTALVWPFELAVFLWPTGMVQVLNSTVSDGYHGLLGWIWVACAVTTIALVGLTWLALKERYYSAVMAALFGTDLMPAPAGIVREPLECLEHYPALDSAGRSRLRRPPG